MIACEAVNLTVSTYLHFWSDIMEIWITVSFRFKQQNLVFDKHNGQLETAIPTTDRICNTLKFILWQIMFSSSYVIKVAKKIEVTQTYYTWSC